MRSSPETAHASRSFVLQATLTNLICLNGQQQADWSSHYRLYSHARVDESALFDAVLQHMLSVSPARKPLMMAMNDTLVKKTGTHIDGIGWKRDSLGPAFQTNLVRGQRYLQFSAAWSPKDGAARMVPILFAHARSASKPARNADEQQWVQYKQAQRQALLSRYAIQHMKALRDLCPSSRALIFCGDGKLHQRLHHHPWAARMLYAYRMDSQRRSFP